MTDTCVDGKVQRVQAMLYAKASNEPEASRTQAGRPLSLPRAGCGESSHVRFGSRGWETTPVGRSVVRPVPTTS